MKPGCDNFVTEDRRVLDVLELVHQVADTDATVLIIGETGTGKELVAQRLHENSSRREQPLLAVNCGAVAETLQESELFGHRKGAFTGALENRIGKFQAAHGGTIFLDEISEMHKSLQVKLLRILQSGEYSPLGATENQYCDVRVVAAANEDLPPLIEAGEFRRDLYYRLNIIRVELPPLRQRRGDIALLAGHFIDKFAAAYRKQKPKVTAEAEQVLLQYDFPGNVRELENIIQRAVILCRDGWITPGLFPREMTAAGFSPDATRNMTFHDAKEQIVADFERAFLTSILTVCHGVVTRAAQACGLSERNFHAKLKKYGIRSEAFRG